MENIDIHANHVEAFNASLRRRLASYRRKTKPYAKNRKRLQERLDVLWIMHKSTRPHFTTRIIPAIAMGIIEKSYSIKELFLARIAV